MPMPKDIGVIDTLLGLPYSKEERLYWVTKFSGLLRDEESKSAAFQHPAGYMFKDTNVDTDDPIGHTLREMDRFGIETAMLSLRDDTARKAIKQHPRRFIPSLHIDPNKGMEEVRALARAHDEYGIVAATFFPCGCTPQVPINDKKAFPIYAKCVELDIAIFVNAGMPGPRMPYEPQYVGLADEVCWFFPDLRFVFRHGCEPWADLAVKLLLKWPNLYYSTSAFAPKYFPKEIVDYANSRGADKVLYAGYYPGGLTIERSFTELQDVPFRDHVWPKFLRENAIKVLKLDKR